jgi:dihydroorotate dehydrogenase (fumarate)
VTQVAGIQLESPVMNAAGTCKTTEDVEELARSSTGAIVVGSITVAQRDGNVGEVYWSTTDHSLNALGLPNAGLAYYSHALPDMAAIARAQHKALIVSVAGFATDEYVCLAREAARQGADLVELNLGCPNVWDEGAQKRIGSFDLDYVERTCLQVGGMLTELAQEVGRLVCFGIKVSPYSDPVELAAVANLLGEIADRVSTFAFVTVSNAFPNAVTLDAGGQPRLDVGFGGLGGPAMKPIGLGQVKQFRAILPESVKGIGVGGISHGGDVHDYLTVGATAVQVATAYLNSRNRAGLFSDLLSDLVINLP